MASLKEDRINVDKLENNVQNAMNAENLYWMRNDAKFRAVKQKGTYDEFKEIVAAAHLKPMEKNDKIQLDEKIVSPWNSTCSKTYGSSQGTINQDTTSLGSQVSLPKNGHEFVKSWRRLKTSIEKLVFLQSIGEEIPTLFKSEIPFGLLGEFIIIMNDQVDNLSQQKLCDLLTWLSRSGRFSLSLTFLSSAEGDTIKSLLARLGPSDTQTLELSAAYNC